MTKRSISSAIRGALVTLAIGAYAGSVVSAEPPASDVCDDQAHHPEFHQLDWWIGRWSVSDSNTDKKHADVTIARPEGGCALIETWHSVASGKESTSNGLIAYDAVAKQWEYFWVSGRVSNHIHLVAKPADELVWHVVTPEDRPTATILTFTHNPDGSLREWSRTKTAKPEVWKTDYDLTWRQEK